MEKSLVNHMEETRSVGACDLANLTTSDVLHAFGNDTELAMSMAKRLLDEGGRSAQGLVQGSKAQGRSCAAVLTRARRQELRAAIGPLPADARVRSHCANFLTGWGAWVLTLATAYHKIVPICSKANTFYAQVEPIQAPILYPGPPLPPPAS